MKPAALLVLLAALLAGGPVASAKMTPEQIKALPAPAAHKVDFKKEIQPLLETSCMKCHGRGKERGDWAIDTRETFLKPAASGPAVVVGRSDESYLIELVAGVDPDNVMPQKGSKLKPEQIALLRAWIDQGLPWDKDVSFGKLAPVNLFPATPAVPRDVRGANPVDAFLKPYYAAHKVAPPKVVDDRSFARRAHLDIIGLLPTPEELNAFLGDKRADKRTRLVQQLLGNNRRYAEHWLTFWNDLLRNDYAGTGYIDGGRKQISRWLYSAIATNMPYDQFVRELINPAPASEGFSKGIVWRGAINASQTPQMQAAQNISQVFMGVNLKCASCHDSFINDWTLADAYGLASVYADGPLEMVHCDKPTGKNATIKFIFPELGPIDAGLTRPERLKRLAEIITQQQNGRLTRTIVNRLWARFMGHGLVEPVDEMDKAAWHPELLDWLATDLAAHGYDLKRTMEWILTSRAYQAPAVATGEQNKDVFVFKGPLVRRMGAEQFRDAITKLTGVGYTLPVADVNYAEGVLPNEVALKTKPMWIWDKVTHWTEAPVGKVFMRKRLVIGEVPDLAVATMTADDNLTMYVNGKRTKTSKDWTQPISVDLRPLLVSGTNVLAFELNNETEKDSGQTNKANPAGFLFHARFKTDRVVDGKPAGFEAELVSDAHWLVSSRRARDWEKVEFDDSKWTNAFVIGPIDTFPWKMWNFETVFAGAASMYGQVRASLMGADALAVALGRPNREQVITTRASAATTLQALELTNGAELARIMQQGAARRLNGQATKGKELVEWVYLQGLGRKPTREEQKLAEQLVGTPVKKEGVEDLLWAMAMLPEFQLIY